MTMVIDNQGRQYGGMGYHSLYSHHMQPSSHFTDPWIHQQSQHSSATYPSLVKQENSRPTNISMPYSQMQTSAPMASGSNFSTAGFGGSDLLSFPQDIPRSTYPAEQNYSSPATTSSYATTNSYPALNYVQTLQQQQQQQHQHQRKLSDPNDHRNANPSFGELDASRGMLALSHQNVAELTPRNIYDVRAQRGSTDSYGFPATHSSGTSISTASGREAYPYYASSSIASADSATDYSSTASDAGYDSMASSRTLPRPPQLASANLGPPAPQSMMGQFSSKMSSNTQKKHKCKICDKRFTRPSSLQTHVYSHTGEKPFACHVDGCGRQFSVVSNLRRHKKVHKGESVSSHSDTED